MIMIDLISFRQLNVRHVVVFYAVMLNYPMMYSQALKLTSPVEYIWLSRVLHPTQTPVVE